MELVGLSRGGFLEGRDWPWRGGVDAVGSLKGHAHTELTGSGLPCICMILLRPHFKH